jgi:hypothetical protein
VSATEERTVGDFSRVEVSGSSNVVVEVGPKSGVTLTCDDNLLPYLITRVDGETLKVEMASGSYIFKTAGEVRVTTPALRSLSVSGSSDSVVTGIAGDRVEFHLSGSGSIQAAGDVEAVDAKVSGSGDLDLRELTAQEAHVRISGSGNVDMTAHQALVARVSGSGDVTYAGTPERLSTRVSGSGTISKR